MVEFAGFQLPVQKGLETPFARVLAAPPVVRYEIRASKQFFENNDGQTRQRIGDAILANYDGLIQQIILGQRQNWQLSSIEGWRKLFKFPNVDVEYTMRSGFETIDIVVYPENQPVKRGGKQTITIPYRFIVSANIDGATFAPEQSGTAVYIAHKLTGKFYIEVFIDIMEAGATTPWVTMPYKVTPSMVELKGAPYIGIMPIDATNMQQLIDDRDNMPPPPGVPGPPGDRLIVMVNDYFTDAGWTVGMYPVATCMMGTRTQHFVPGTPGSDGGLADNTGAIRAGLNPFVEGMDSVVPDDFGTGYHIEPYVPPDSIDVQPGFSITNGTSVYRLRLIQTPAGQDEDGHDYITITSAPSGDESIFISGAVSGSGNVVEAPQGQDGANAILFAGGVWVKDVKDGVIGRYNTDVYTWYMGGDLYYTDENGNQQGPTITAGQCLQINHNVGTPDFYTEVPYTYDGPFRYAGGGVDSNHVYRVYDGDVLHKVDNVQPTAQHYEYEDGPDQKTGDLWKLDGVSDVAKPDLGKHTNIFKGHPQSSDDNMITGTDDSKVEYKGSFDPPPDQGDTYMLAVDTATGDVWIGRNGSWFNDGDPGTGSGATANMNATDQDEDGSIGFYPFIGYGNYGNAAFKREDRPMKATMLFVAGDFKYDIPKGFSAALPDEIDLEIL